LREVELVQSWRITNGVTGRHTSYRLTPLTRQRKAKSHNKGRTHRGKSHHEIAFAERTTNQIGVCAPYTYHPQQNPPHSRHTSISGWIVEAVRGRGPKGGRSAGSRLSEQLSSSALLQRGHIHACFRCTNEIDAIQECHISITLIALKE